MQQHSPSHRYRVVAPDYRGAGLSSKPDGGFTKPVMAADMAQLLDCLNITQSVHLVGHDIGGMIAYAFASRFPERTASVNWGECPLPGTSVHDEDRSADQQFHFLFHSVLDLLEALVIDREDIYLNHFFGKLLYNTSSISSQDLDHYVRMYSQPGALRCAFNIYRVFLQDAEENHAWIACHSKCKVRALGLSGAKSRHKETAGRMFAEVHEASTFRVAEVPASGHYIADQNPNGFSKAVVDFIEEDAV